MGQGRDRSWHRHHRKRVIRKRLKDCLNAGHWYEDYLTPRVVGKFAKTSPFFCGCTKSRGMCKWEKRFYSGARRRERKRIPTDWDEA